MKTTNENTKVNDLRVWWIPQVPGSPFYAKVRNVEEGVLLMNTLAAYDAFQFENNIKPDYCNVGGLQIYISDAGDGRPDWIDWFDEETGEDNPEEYLLQKQCE